MKDKKIFLPEQAQGDIVSGRHKPLSFSFLLLKCGGYSNEKRCYQLKLCIYQIYPANFINIDLHNKIYRLAILIKNFEYYFTCFIMSLLKKSPCLFFFYFFNNKNLIVIFFTFICKADIFF